MLEVIDVDAGYGDVEVLRGVSLSISEGEVVSVVGANGAGKTTLLSAISGLRAPSSGKIMFDGFDITELPANKVVERGLALIPEGRGLFPGLTVEENLKLGAYHRDARRQRRASFDEVMELFPVLADRRVQLAGSLSGGEQQMCALARGLMSRPKLLMLDEPSLGLAPIIVELLFETITALRDRGMTLLLVEQNVAEALELSTRGYVMDQGQITMGGPAAELLQDRRIQEAYLGA